MVLPTISWTVRAGSVGSMRPHNYDAGLVVVPVEGEAGNMWRRVGLFEKL